MYLPVHLVHHRMTGIGLSMTLSINPSCMKLWLFRIQQVFSLFIISGNYKVSRYRISLPIDYQNKWYNIYSHQTSNGLCYLQITVQDVWQVIRVDCTMTQDYVSTSIEAINKILILERSFSFSFICVIRNLRWNLRY